MIKNVLTHTGGIGLYGVVSVCLFFTVFIVSMFFVLLKKRSFLNHMSTLPLANDAYSGPCPQLKGDLRHE